eukprot:s768_g4.t1
MGPAAGSRWWQCAIFVFNVNFGSEFAKQAPFAPRIRAPRRSRNDKVERHLILYDKHLEMAQKRRDKQEQKLRDEQEYLERHSVHRTASSPRSPQASDAAVYQRLHEEAELKRQRLEQREKAVSQPQHEGSRDGS